MQINSLVLVSDKNMSLYDSLHLLFDNDVLEMITWNSEGSSYEEVFTYTDIAEIVMNFFQNVIIGADNAKIYR